MPADKWTPGLCTCRLLINLKNYWNWESNGERANNEQANMNEEISGAPRRPAGNQARAVKFDESVSLHTWRFNIFKKLTSQH